MLIISPAVLQDNAACTYKSPNGRQPIRVYDQNRLGALIPVLYTTASDGVFRLSSVPFGKVYVEHEQ